MIIWVASFPRSGNTFLRIILKQLYGVRTSTVYDVDGVAERLGPDLIGFEERPSPIEEMRASEKLHFVKTHRQRAGEEDRAICLVRDGRDSITSWARLTGAPDVEAGIRAIIDRRDEAGTGSWGRNVLSWLRPPAPQRVMLRYEELISRPRPAVENVLATLAPACGPCRTPAFPPSRSSTGSTAASSGEDTPARTRTSCRRSCTSSSGPAPTTSRPWSCSGTRATPAR
ncbi:sulfotransferase domain-containing protein [Nonomuraea thailandensis]